MWEDQIITRVLLLHTTWTSLMKSMIRECLLNPNSLAVAQNRDDYWGGVKMEIEINSSRPTQDSIPVPLAHHHRDRGTHATPTDHSPAKKTPAKHAPFLYGFGREIHSAKPVPEFQNFRLQAACPIEKFKTCSTYNGWEFQKKEEGRQRRFLLIIQSSLMLIYGEGKEGQTSIIEKEVF